MAALPQVQTLDPITQALQSIGVALNKLVDGLENGTLAVQFDPAVAGSLVTNQVTVGTSAVKLIDANPDRKFLGITNPGGGQDIFIGGDDTVTDSTGYLIATGADPFEMRESVVTGEVWAVTTASTATVSVLEMG